MARSFNGTSDYIDLSIGGMASVAAPFTCMAIINRSAVGSRAFAAINSGSTRRSEFKFNGSGQLQWTLPGVNDAPVTSLTVNDSSGWALVGLSKASGSAAPRGHRYLYTGGTWTHANSGTSVGNPTAGTSFRLGAIATPADYWAGDIAVVGFWNRVLSDAETETLTAALSDWLALSPSTLFALNQASTGTAITDLTSGGSTQSAISGTSISASDPPGFSYSLSATYSAAGTSTASAASSLAVSALLSATGTSAATTAVLGAPTSLLAAAGTTTASANSALGVTALLPAQGSTAAASATSMNAVVLRPASGQADATSATSLTVGLVQPAAGSTVAAASTALSVTALLPTLGTTAAVSTTALTASDAGSLTGRVDATSGAALAVGLIAAAAGTITAGAGMALAVTALLAAGGSTAASTTVSLTLTDDASGVAAAVSSTSLTVTATLPVGGTVPVVTGVSLTISGGTDRDLTYTVILGPPSWQVLAGTFSWTGQRGDPMDISVLSREYIAARLTSMGGNGSPAVVFNTQPVHLGIVPEGTAPQLNQFFPAEWVGPASFRRWCRMLVGPSGGVATYTAGTYDLYARVEDTTETAIRKIAGQVTFK